MWKIFGMQGNYRWLKILPKIINNYNNTIHSKIKMRPIDVKKEHEKSNNRPATFLLKDYENNKIHGSFYEQEIHKTKFPDTYLVEKVV